MWLCDVYEGCLTCVSAFFASVPKLILFGVLIKLHVSVFVAYQDFSASAMLFSGVLSVLFAAVGGLYQKRTKRLVAYSAVSHTGFLLLGLAPAGLVAVFSCLVYVFLYVLMILATFSILMLAGVNKRTPKYVINWGALAACNPALATTFSLLLFSACGMPPLAGFYSKLCVLFSLVSGGFPLAALAAVLLSAVTCFYYIRLIKNFFFTSSSKKNFWVGRVSRAIAVILALFVTLLTFFLVRPHFLGVSSTILSASLLLAH
jgi:NADH-quinone oxidoreductase subunit N